MIRTIGYFEEALPGQNIFIVLLPENKKECDYVKVEMSCVHYERYNSKSFWAIVGDIKQYNHIIYHYLHDHFCYFTLAIPKGSPITWIVWGADLYNHLLVKKGYKLYAEPLENNMIPIEIQDGKFIDKICAYIKETIKYAIRKKAIKRIHTICACDGDYQLFNKYFPELAPFQRKPFFYYPVDDIIGDDLKKMSCVGDDIIVGNSASYSNNHKYVFELLGKIDLGKRKVIVPLSYGWGKESVLEAGKILGNHFVPLTKLLPLNEYNTILSNARTFIYGNFRQEAVGNILIAFYLGGAVFFDKRNPLLVDLGKKGYIFFTLDQLKDKINYRLTEEERSHNRELVLQNYNKQLMFSYIKESFG